MTWNHEWEVQGLSHKVRKCRKINTEIEQKNNKIAACSKFKWALFYAYTNCHFEQDITSGIFAIIHVLVIMYLIQKTLSTGKNAILKWSALCKSGISL